MRSYDKGSESSSETQQGRSNLSGGATHPLAYHSRAITDASAILRTETSLGAIQALGAAQSLTDTRDQPGHNNNRRGCDPDAERAEDVLQIAAKTDKIKIFTREARLH